MYYTNANKTGMAGYHGPATKVMQTPYNSVQKAEISAIILLLTVSRMPLILVLTLSR